MHEKELAGDILVEWMEFNKYPRIKGYKQSEGDDD